MKLFYREQGEGFPIIILHGIFGSSDNWLTVTKRLAENFKVYLIDQRNHGKSEHSSDFNYKVMAEDLYQFMNELNIEEAFLIGHSMGGKVAMRFATEYPEKIKKLIVVDISPKYYPVHHEVIIKGLNSVPLEKIKNRQEADEALAKFVPELEVRQFLLKNLKREGDYYKWSINLPVIEKEIENIGEAQDAKKKFEKPTLFVRGGKSNYIKDADIELINQIFLNAKLATIESAGHWVQAEAPEEFIEVVETFFKN